MSKLLRTKEMEERYREYRTISVLSEECILCKKEPIRSFKYWKIITNDFPYNRIAAQHHMILPIRHTNESSLTKEEWKEIVQIKQSDIPEYDYFLEPSRHSKSIPNHFHVHLTVVKDFDSD